MLSLCMDDWILVLVLVSNWNQVIEDWALHGENAPEFAGSRHFNEVDWPEVDVFETVIPESEYINGQVEPLVPAKQVDWDSGMEGI